MTTAEFMQQIQERYGSPDKDIHRQDIIETLQTLDDDERQKLWTLFLNNYNYQRPPRRGDFHRIMRDNNITERGGFAKKWAYYYTCSACGQVYNQESRACPKCRSEDRRLSQAEHLPDEVVWAHENCYRCKKYAMSIYCPEWAKGEPLPQCGTCECKVCCRAERLARNDYQLYRQLLRDKPGTVDELVDPLVEKHRYKEDEG